MYLLVNQLTQGRGERGKIKAYFLMQMQTVLWLLFQSRNILDLKNKNVFNFLGNFSVVVADVGQQYPFSDWQLQPSNSLL